MENWVRILLSTSGLNTVTLALPVEPDEARKKKSGYRIVTIGVAASDNVDNFLTSFGKKEKKKCTHHWTLNGHAEHVQSPDSGLFLSVSGFQTINLRLNIYVIRWQAPSTRIGLRLLFLYQVSLELQKLCL